MGNTAGKINSPNSYPSLNFDHTLHEQMPKSEPNIRIHGVDKSVFEFPIESNIDIKTSSLDKLQEGNILRRVSLPIPTVRSYCGSLELDKIHTVIKSPVPSLNLDDKLNKGQIEQPHPDEMYTVGPDTPTRQDTMESSLYQFEELQNTVFRWILEEEDEHTLRHEFKNIQDKLRSTEEVRIKDVVKLDQIGKARYGPIHRVFHRMTRKFYALKTIEISDKSEAISSWKEIKALFHIQKSESSNILKLYDVEYEQKLPSSSETSKPLFFILTELGQASLKDYADFKYINSIPWEEKELINTLYSMLQQYSTLKAAGVSSWKY